MKDENSNSELQAASESNDAPAAAEGTITHLAPAGETVVEQAATPAPATDDAPPAPAGDDAPAIGSDEWVENASPEELRDYLSGSLTAETAEEDVEAAPAAEEQPAATDEAADAAPAFEFTEDADVDTYLAEREKAVEMYEFDPTVKAMLDRDAAIIAEFKANAATNAFAGDESVTKHMTAFDRLVEFREDPDTHEFVPDTGGVLELLQTDYANELPQIVEDVNTMPSQKYPGLTMFQQFIRDYANLDGGAMQQLDYFLKNNGRFAVPAFVPEGINPKLAEAFWTAENRDEITLKIERAAFTLQKDPDATAEEKAAAQRDLQVLNGQLAQIQNGLDATKARLEAEKQAQTQAQTAIHDEAVDRFVGTTRGIIEIIATKSMTGLEVLDDTGAGITGTAFATLVENAFSDNDGYAKYYQDKLASYGVKADWAKAYALRDRLFQSEMKVIALEKSGANPRAVENAKREKDGVVKELLSLAHEAAGKMNAKLVAGAGKKLAKQIATAPKIQAARPKASGDGTRAVPKGDFENMSVDELRRVIREEHQKANPYARAARGDLSAFTS